MATPPLERSRSQGLPMPICADRERGVYWVRMATLKMPELTQLERTKSIIRYRPAKGTAGLALSAERIESLSPAPPARTIAKTRCITHKNLRPDALGNQPTP